MLPILDLARPIALRFIPAALCLFFFVFYYFTGQKLKDAPMYERDDVFFRADTRRALNDITGDRKRDHAHTSGHPNFVIFHALLGNNLRYLIKSRNRTLTGKEATKQASIVMTAAAGAGTVALFYALLVAHGLPRLRAALFTSILGCSTVQIFYASTPETYIFSALGITSIAYLASRRETGEGWWQLAAVYAWSALTTNIALVGIWALARYWTRPLSTLAMKLVRVMGLTVILTVAISFLQSAIFPKTMLFFMPSAVARESGWLYWERLQHPIETARVLLQHQWLSNIIAPEPVQTIVFGRPMASIEAGSWGMVAPSMPLLLLWGCFLAGAATSLRFRSFYQPVILAALGTLAFNFAFFFVFGHDRMLYAALWTSTSVFIVATAVEALLKRQPKLAIPATALLAALVLGQSWHNWHFLAKLVALV